MNTFNHGQRELTAPSVGIAGYLQEYQQMRWGAVYWLSIDTHVNALRFGLQTLVSLDLSHRAVVVGCDKVSVIISALKDNQGPAELNRYTLKGELSEAVLRLTEQLDRKLRPVKRLIVCLLPIESLGFLEKNSRTLLKSWRDWCENNGCTLLIVTYGEQAQRISQPLISEGGFLSGLAHLTTYKNNYVYHVDYWVNSLGVQAAQRFILKDKSAGFELLKAATPQLEKVSGEVFLQRIVLEGAPIYMAEKWRVAENWPALVSAARTAVRGTFVFALSSTADLEPLARTLYKLRQHRGAAISLVVREMQQVLRTQEMQLLLQCGANLVVSADTHLARFFSMLEGLKNQQATEPLAHDLESAIAKIKAPDVKGAVSVLEFTFYLKNILASASIVDINGILVTMRPAPALTVEQCMGQLKVDRQGDVACTANGIVYLFLFGCQRDFIEVALQRVFLLPFKDIISEHQVHTDHVSIENHVRRLRVLNKAQTSPSLEHASNKGLTAHIAPHRAQQDKRTVHLFKPFIKSL